MQALQAESCVHHGLYDSFMNRDGCPSCKASVERSEGNRWANEVDGDKYEYIVNKSTKDPSAPPTHELRPKHRAASQPEKPTRQARRDAARRERKANQRANLHNCVIKQAAIRYGVHLVVQAGAEQHKLHVAMGEPWCSACSACALLRAQKRPATVLSDEEAGALLDYWERKVDVARGRPEAKKRIEARRAFDAAVFGGRRG